MFETLTKGFRTAKQRFQGLAELDDATVDEALKDVRTALLEADVGFDVVNDFCARVKEKAVGVIVKVKASTKEKTTSCRATRSYSLSKSIGPHAEVSKTWTYRRGVSADSDSSSWPEERPSPR